MAKQLVKVKRDLLEACMKCQLCNKLMKEATTVSLCLHKFCRKCIYGKVSDEGVDTCPVCDIELGCVPMEKLRPDHNLQDIRFKIFPYNRAKIEASDIIIPSSSQLPTKRKERSLSSLVVSAPKVSPKISGLAGLTGRRSKTNARKASSLGGCSFTVKGSGKNDPAEKKPISLFTKSIQDASPVQPNNESNKVSGNEMVILEGKVDLWTPLNSLVEAVNRTKLSKSIKQESLLFQDSILGGSETQAKENSLYAQESELCKIKRKKTKNYQNKKVQDGKHYSSLCNGPAKRRKLRAMVRQMGSVFDRRNSSVWFSLVPSEDQRGDASLPRISACYLRIKDSKVPVSFIQKYLVKKLDLTSESEVEIMCRGEPIMPTLSMKKLVELWLRTASTSKKVTASAGSSAKEFVMVLSYCRKTPPP